MSGRSGGTRRAGYPGSAEPTPADDVPTAVVGALVGMFEVGGVGGAVVALAVPVAEDCGVPLALRVGPVDTVAEPPFVGCAVGGADVPAAVPVGRAEEVPLGNASGVGAGGSLVTAALAPGCGRGTCGLLSPLS